MRVFIFMPARPPSKNNDVLQTTMCRRNINMDTSGVSRGAQFQVGIELGVKRIDGRITSSLTQQAALDIT